MRKISDIEKAWAVDVLKSFLQNGERERLEYGAKTKAMLLEQIEKGEVPDHYRLDWLNTSAGRVMSLLVQITKEFNAEYPRDQVSVSDLQDILLSVMARLQKLLRASEDSESESGPKATA